MDPKEFNIGDFVITDLSNVYIIKEIYSGYIRLVSANFPSLNNLYSFKSIPEHFIEEGDIFYRKSKLSMIYFDKLMKYEKNGFL